MKTREEYFDFFSYMDCLKRYSLLSASDYVAISIHVFDAVVLTKTYSLEELSEKFPNILGNIKKLYEEIDLI